MTQQTNKNWIEDISSYLHKLRANWYVHQKYNMSDKNYERREKQAKTSYENLSEEDKEKDRKITREIIHLLPDYELLEKIKELIEKYEKRLRKLKFKKVWTTEILDEMDLLNPFIKDLQSLLPTNKDEQTTK